MRYYPGITDKRVRNKRFMGTEQDILSVFFEREDDITINKMAKEIGVALSTIYHHHRAIWKIIPDYKKFILQKYRKQIRRALRKKNARMHSLYMMTILFILQHREVFDVVTRGDERSVVTAMINELMPKSEKVMHLPKNSSTILAIYSSEITELLWHWMKNGCDADEIEALLHKMMYLTETARDRLKPLLD